MMVIRFLLSLTIIVPLMFPTIAFATAIYGGPLDFLYNKLDISIVPEAVYDIGLVTERFQLWSFEATAGTTAVADAVKGTGNQWVNVSAVNIKARGTAESTSLASSVAFSGGLWSFMATNNSTNELLQPLGAELSYSLNTSVDFPAFDFALSQVGYFIRGDGGDWLSLVDISTTNNDPENKVVDLVSNFSVAIPGKTTKIFDVLFFVGGMAVSDTPEVNQGLPFGPEEVMAIATIPEPATLVLMLLGCFYFILFIKTRQRASGRNNIAQIPN